jgi:hypothetical protein
MKKLYNVLFASAVMVSANTFAQSDFEKNGPLHLTADQTKAVFSGLQNGKSLIPAQKMAVSCDSLTVQTIAGNGYNGNMFDITVASNFTLETFAVSMDAGTWNVAIYYRTGTYVGSETSSAGWTFLDSASITSTTTDAATFYKVPVNLNLPLMAGSTYGFYVTGTDPASPINYTNGTSVGTVFASNANFSVKEGAGGAYPFNVTNSPRVFNGEVYFCNGITGIDENGEASLDLYPNPASQSVSLDLSGFNGSTVMIRIINPMGQLVYAGQHEAKGLTDLDLTAYPAGLYFVQVELNGKVSTRKLAIR